MFLEIFSLAVPSLMPKKKCDIIFNNNFLGVENTVNLCYASCVWLLRDLHSPTNISYRALRSLKIPKISYKL